MEPCQVAQHRPHLVEAHRIEGRREPGSAFRQVLEQKAEAPGGPVELAGECHRGLDVEFVADIAVETDLVQVHCRRGPR